MTEIRLATGRFKLYRTKNLTVIEGECEVSLRSSSQQPPAAYQMRSAPAATISIFCKKVFEVIFKTEVIFKLYSTENSTVT